MRPIPATGQAINQLNSIAAAPQIQLKFNAVIAT